MGTVFALSDDTGLATQTIDNGVRDEIEHYNCTLCADLRFIEMLTRTAVHRAIFHQQHPKALQPFLQELRSFTEYNHYNILFPILR